MKQQPPPCHLSVSVSICLRARFFTSVSPWSVLLVTLCITPGGVPFSLHFGAARASHAPTHAMAGQDSGLAIRASQLWLNDRLERVGLRCYDFGRDLNDGVILCVEAWVFAAFVSSFFASTALVSFPPRPEPHN